MLNSGWHFVLIREWLLYVLYWIFFTVFFTFISLSFMRALIAMMELEHLIVADAVRSYMISNYQYLESVLFGAFFGTATFAINYFVDRTQLHRLSAGRIILIKTTLYSLSMILVFIIVAVILNTLDILPADMWILVQRQVIPVSMVLGVLSFFVAGSLMVNFIVFVNKKFGPGNLVPIFLGKYHRPEVEDRIFMFLDLDGSTTIAEQIGHIKYSRLLQDCFLEINRLVPLSRGKIYQYVGDEVVLTWSNGQENAALRPVQLFFAFRSRLHSKAHYYKSRYGVVPDFKAGVHGGLVTVSEIGDIKREIAYHGDVVNTASRLRDACTNFEKPLLASETLAQKLPDGLGYNKSKLGKIQLRGKLSQVDVYSID
jgi:adenylate cyclase